MSWIRIHWNDSPGKNVDKVQRNGLSCEDVDSALINPEGYATSESSGREIIFGRAIDGSLIAVPYDEIDEDTVYPVTAFRVPEGY